MRLDLAFFGRHHKPIVVSPVHEIERRAAWGQLLAAVKFVGCLIVTVAGGMTLLWLWSAV